MGLLTIALLAFFGFTFRESDSQRTLGYLLIALASVRSLLWLREVALWIRAKSVPDPDHSESDSESDSESALSVSSSDSPASGTSTRPEPTK